MEMTSSFRKVLTILRYNGKPELCVDGTYILPKATEMTILASVQPLKANEVNILPEGMRTSRAVKVYSGVELLVANQQEGMLADRFIWRGMTFEVVASDIYQCAVINHYRAYAVEVNAF